MNLPRGGDNRKGGGETVRFANYNNHQNDNSNMTSQYPPQHNSMDPYQQQSSQQRQSYNSQQQQGNSYNSRGGQQQDSYGKLENSYSSHNEKIQYSSEPSHNNGLM